MRAPKPFAGGDVDVVATTARNKREAVTRFKNRASADVTLFLLSHA